jgi:hypothetical protein
MESISWLLVSTTPLRDSSGADIPIGTAIAREMWDCESDWDLPEGTTLAYDDSRPIWQPAVVGGARVLPAQAWLARLPAAVLAAVMLASRTDAQLMMLLTFLAARGTIDLSDPNGLLHDLLGQAMRATSGSATPLTPAVADAMLLS